MHSAVSSMMNTRGAKMVALLRIGLVFAGIYIQAIAKDAEPCRYHVGFLSNPSLVEDLDKHLELQLSTTCEHSVLVDISTPLISQAINKTVLVKQGTVTNVRLPYENLLVESILQRKKGILVQANDSLVLHGLNQGEFSSDSFLALPCHSYNVTKYTYYIVSLSMTRTLETYKSQFLLVPCEDKTSITVTPTQELTLPLEDRLTDIPRSFVKVEEKIRLKPLNALETFRLASFEDLTGTKIESDKPLSVFSGHECADVPVGTKFCDHLVEQVPPTLTWGRSFLTGSWLFRLSGELYRVVASEPSTVVRGQCTPINAPTIESFTEHLSLAGSYADFYIRLDRFCSFHADKPVMLTQFGASLRVDGRGDPSLSIVPPVEQYTSEYTYLAHRSYQNFINIMIPVFRNADANNTVNVTLDGKLILPHKWNAVHCSDDSICGYVARLNVTGRDASHTVESSAPVGVMVYGYADARSYAHPAGMKLSHLSVPEVNLTVSNESVSHANEAEDVVLTCEAAGLSREAYRIVWMRNGAVVEGMTQTQYVIRPAQQDVGFGNYTCLVDDGSGNYSRSLLIQEKANFRVRYQYNFPNTSVKPKPLDRDLLADLLKVTPAICSECKITSDNFDIKTTYMQLDKCPTHIPDCGILLEGSFTFASANGEHTAATILETVALLVDGRHFRKFDGSSIEVVAFCLGSVDCTNVKPDSDEGEMKDTSPSPDTTPSQKDGQSQMPQSPILILVTFLAINIMIL